jgi:hypothetical protein
MIKKISAVLLGLAALLGAVYLVGTKVVELQKLWPDLYYGSADESCNNDADFGNALRNGKIKIVRCFIEKGKKSANLQLPPGSPHPYHTPMALAAESCNLSLVKYLVLLRGADPRNGHNNDTPEEIAKSHCRGGEQNPVTVFIREQVFNIDQRDGVHPKQKL